MFMFDPTYFILVIPALLLATWAQSKVRGAFEEYSRVRSRRGETGAEVAREILRDAGLQNVSVEPTRKGTLSDHYDPREKVVRLSEDVYHRSTLAAIGIAAHEAGHALQDASNYVWLGMRNAIIPVTQFGSKMAFPLFFIGLLFRGDIGSTLMLVGLVFFGAAVVFQLITLPVELNASAQALQILQTGEYVTREEQQGVREVLNAAALTYLAAALMAIMQFVYLFMLRGRRR